MYRKFVTDVWETKCKNMTEIQCTQINDFTCSGCKFCVVEGQDNYCKKRKIFVSKDDYCCKNFKKIGRR